MQLKLKSIRRERRELIQGVDTSSEKVEVILKDGEEDIDQKHFRIEKVLRNVQTFAQDTKMESDSKGIEVVGRHSTSNKKSSLESVNVSTCDICIEAI